MLEYTMNIEIHDKSKAESFCNIFQVVKTFSEHVNLTINDEKLYVQSMDASHIVIFEIHLPKEWFDVFEKGGNEENITIGIHAGVLGKVLNTRDKSHKIILIDRYLLWIDNYLLVYVYNITFKIIPFSQIRNFYPEFLCYFS